MIIQLRGTSGSGKSTIVKHVMQRFPRIVKLHREGRRQPIGYLCGDDKGLRLQIIGHYETACGGCDTITSLDDVYQQVTQAATFGYDVLYEGIMASGEYKRCVELHRAGLDLLVIGLDVPQGRA